MKALHLGEIIAPATVKRAGGGDYPVLSITMHQGLIEQSKKFKKQVASQDQSDYKVVKRGQLVVGFPIDEGVLDFQDHYDAAIVSPAYGIWDLQDERVVDRSYLARFLRSPRAMTYYKTKLRGSTARRRSLPKEVFLALDVPLPPLAEQRRIAAILDQADAIRTKQRQVVHHLAGLAEAIFLDMFGDPDQALASGSVERFGEVADLQGGRNLVADDQDSVSEFRVLKISAVTSGDFKPSESKALPAGYVPPADHLVRQGDLLISRANTAELVGAVAYVEDAPYNLVLPDKVWRFVWRNPDSVPLYYRSLFRTPSVRRRISQLASGTGGSMKNISKSKLVELELPAVTSAQQREFARRVGAIPRTSHSEIDELLCSLQSRAFAGQL